MLQTNSLGTIRVLDQCRRSRCPITLASSYVYGAQGHRPIDENQPARPGNPYALSKFLAEEAGRGFAALYDLPVSIVRVQRLRSGQRTLRVRFTSCASGPDRPVWQSLWSTSHRGATMRRSMMLCALSLRPSVSRASEFRCSLPRVATRCGHHPDSGCAAAGVSSPRVDGSDTVSPMCPYRR